MGWGIPYLRGTASEASNNNNLFNHYSKGSLGAYLIGSSKVNSFNILCPIEDYYYY